MYKKIFLFLLLALVPYIGNATETKDNVVKLRIYGHAYLEDKNNPLLNFEVYLKKNDQEISSTKTNKEWYYDFLIDNREDYINLCIKSTSFSSIQNVNFCSVVSAFQKIWKEIDWVEVREVEYDFYTNKSWENLNERLEKDITNSETQSAYQQMEDTKILYEEKNKIKEAEDKKMKELEDLKAKYNMPNNTEMSGPLESIQIIGTVVWDPNIHSDLLPSKTNIIITDHYGTILKEEELSNTHDFNIIVRPKEWDFFLHPVNFKVENKQFGKDGSLLYKSEYRLITKEKNIVNIVLWAYKKDDNKVQVVRESSLLLFFEILSIIIVCMLLIVIIIKNRKKINTNDY